MARTTLQLQFNGTPSYVLDVMITYPRQYLRHVFTTPGELWDITNIATAEEINRNSTMATLFANGTLSLVVTPGYDDVGDINPAKLSVIGAGIIAVPAVIYVPLTSGGTSGTADDVTVYNGNAPFQFRISSSHAVISTAVSSSTLEGRTLAGGAGSSLTGVVSSAAVGPVGQGGTALTSSKVVPVGGSLFIRRSDRSVVGEFFISIFRV